ncbi:hypothetical protein [Amycolatopsis sp. WQ 127309]|uniref:hypothetical protein n=1 Tax=Amycolatopsis sp. WQ 127309 TaxID=2932773 RepID=UPI001FF4F1AD|nr:hypothetical protein [Amycolatopsis sp. WQ 127309]UOZ10736.1 hypothetical protein MUY22_21695 [Amycolatopsis sp. WQ 127309]
MGQYRAVAGVQVGEASGGRPREELTLRREQQPPGLDAWIRVGFGPRDVGREVRRSHHREQGV